MKGYKLCPKAKGAACIHDHEGNCPHTNRTIDVKTMRCWIPKRPREMALKKEINSAWSFLNMASIWIEENYKPKDQIHREDKAIWLERVEKWLQRNKLTA